MSNKGLISLFALLAAIVLFFAVNIVAGRAISGARVDLTEGKLYTLSPGSKAIAKNLNEPIKFTLYLSHKAATDEPAVSSYSQRVRETLQEFVRASGGKITLSVVDPEPFSESEDKAVGAGITPVGNPQSPIYFGLAASNSVDRTETIPFFHPAKEEFLEYDISKLIIALSDAPRKAIGLMTWLPLEGSEGNPMMGGRGTPAWQIDRQLKEAFDVKPVATNAKEIPADIKALMIVQPKSMTEATQYAVDQFVLRGGRVLVFVDPNCDADVPPGVNQFQAMQIPKNSDLPKLMAAWGVEMVPGKVAADRDTAVSVPVGQGGRQELAPYIAGLMLDKKYRSGSDPVTGQLERLVVWTCGILQKKEGATTDVQPLLFTSDKASALEVTKISAFPEPKKLLADYTPGSTSLWLAVRVTGKAKSAFPDGEPATPPEPAKRGEKKEDAPKPTHIAESAAPINVIVVADADMLADRFWIREMFNLGGQPLYEEFSDNGTFVRSALDNLSGASELMGLRARAKFARPFTRIQDLEKEAQQRYQKKEQDLQTKLREAEQKINDLQKKRTDAKETRIALTAEQQREIDEFRSQMVQTRKELREVRFSLDKDTRELRNRLMAVNIGLMPALVGVFAVGLAAYRGARRKADRAAASKD